MLVFRLFICLETDFSDELIDRNRVFLYFFNKMINDTFVFLTCFKHYIKIQQGHLGMHRTRTLVRSSDRTVRVRVRSQGSGSVPLHRTKRV